MNRHQKLSQSCEL